MRQWIAGLLLAGLMVVGCDQVTAAIPSLREPAPVAVSEAEIETLQGVAESACKCARANPGDRSCWKEFKAQTRRFPSGGESATACAPIWTSGRCFNHSAPDGGFCITTEYHGGFSEKPSILCTAEEAQIVEATWYRTLKETGEDYGQANAAAQRAVEALMRGDRVAKPEAEAGCSG